ncbi:MAG TPA: cytochrome c [Stellaceae bacterium]
MNAIDQAGGAAQFLKVPLVGNLPGGIKPPSIQNPVANDPAAAERGMRYFESFNCVGCHAANGGGGMGPALSNRAFKFGSDPAHLFLVISHGAPLGMPSWGSVLPENVIWDLVAYVKSISQAPDKEWGTTVSPAIDMPAIQQVPAEFKQTATPWQFTEPFGNGNAPSESSSGAAGIAPPAASGSSGQ